MRPALYARETDLASVLDSQKSGASMRPALYARETAPDTFDRSWFACSFNEARALCAGNFHADVDQRRAKPASMRPALYARETYETSCQSLALQKLQ